MIIAFTDGASSGNPGPMGIGVVLIKDGFVVEELSEYLGEGTNNIAEYKAIIKALETAHSMGEMEVHIKSDSELAIRQLTNVYKVKDPELVLLKKHVEHLCAGIKVSFEHISRERNNEADKLSKEAVILAQRRQNADRK